MEVYRFKNRVAINPPKGATFYISTEAAKKLAESLLMFSSDINTVSFGNSTIRPTIITEK